jgi:hypothetical protein
LLGYSPYYCIDAFVLTAFFIESCIVMTNYLPVETFIARWRDIEGGQERANYALFLSELCDILAVPRPDPADATHENNDYVLERTVKLGHLWPYRSLQARMLCSGGQAVTPQRGFQGSQPRSRAKRQMGCPDAQRPCPGAAICPVFAA